MVRQPGYWSRPPYSWWETRAGLFRLAPRAGQLEGPCPNCGGADRFHVSRDPDGLINCRKCGDFAAILSKARALANGAPIQQHPAPTPTQSRGRSPNNKKAPTGPPTSKQIWRFPAGGGKTAVLHRLNYADGAKRIWRTKRKDAPPPYLPLPGFNPAKPVLIVEGPKAVDCARRMGFNATCWFGPPAIVKETDWRVLTGGIIHLWADADDPGRQCMEVLAGVLAKLPAKKIFSVSTDGLAVAADIADTDADEAKARIAAGRLIHKSNAAARKPAKNENQANNPTSE